MLAQQPVRSVMRDVERYTLRGEPAPMRVTDYLRFRSATRFPAAMLSRHRFSCAAARHATVC